MTEGRLGQATTLAIGSVVVAIAVLALKGVAWWLTGSVALMADALESIVNVAAAVAEESPELYYEIQALNDYGGESLAALADAVEKVRRTVRERDLPAFRALMEQGQAYLQGRRQETLERA